MTQSILLEVPGAILLENSDYITGAYTSSVFLYRELIKSHAHCTIFILSDCKADAFELFRNTQFPDFHFVLLSYDTMASYIHKDHQPSFAFLSDLGMERLMAFRNQHQLVFPIVGLMHSLGMPQHFDTLKKVLQASTSLDCLICPSQSAMQTVKAYSKLTRIPIPLALTVVPFGIQLEKFKKSQKKVDLKAALNIPYDAVVLLHLSRFNPSTKMDVMPLLEMMPQILEACPEAYLLMVGQPHATDYVAQLKHCISQGVCKDRIQVITEPDVAHVEKYYRASDIFVSFSDGVGETFGLTILEAMASELPVVISDWNGYKELIEEGVQGYKIPTYRVSSPVIDQKVGYTGVVTLGDTLGQSVAIDFEWAQDCLIKLLQNTVLRSAIAKNGIEHVYTYFNAQRMVAGYLACFEKVKAKAKKVSRVKYPAQSIPCFTQLFRHFSTQHLTVKTRFFLSDRGQRVLNKQETLKAFEAHLTRYAFLPHVLHGCKKHPATAFSIGKQHQKDPELILLSCLYAMKHGLLKIRR